MGFYQKWGEKATLILIAGALLPDIDHFSLLWGNFLYLKHHRGFTHSFLGALFLSFLVAIIVSIVRRPSSVVSFLQRTTDNELRTFFTNFLLLTIGSYIHILLDLITSYGTAIFLPFSSRRYSLDLVFILDPLFSSLFLIPLVLSFFKRDKARYICGIGAISILCYLSLCYYNQFLALEIFKNFLEQKGIVFHNIATIPAPFFAVRWSGIAQGDNFLYQSQFSILKKDSIILKEYKNHLNTRYIQRAEDLEMVKLYRSFAKFPWVSQKFTENGHYLVEYFDLRFNLIPPYKPFLLKILFDEEGNVLRTSLHNHWPLHFP